ncbi:hypothetical protein HORIV_26530 [Vreelandella olivaria]|uniref:Uncharacterized protein n=1 Tax=Vreelandella olivaria TaxID=390919 RepID=A0ABM7GHW9_9GAMM|nr:hypothetical protein HORIV_26530 [Halomonas olivaria]
MTLSPDDVLAALKQVWPKSPLPAGLPKLPGQVHIEMNSRKLAEGDILWPCLAASVTAAILSNKPLRLGLRLF